VNAIVRTLLLGVMFGAVLHQTGFSQWDEVHAMFVFEDLRLTLTFMVAVAAIGVAWLVLARHTRASFSRRRVHPGIVPGAALFGIGWALSGACPSIALVQIGEGQVGALWTLAGVFVGNWLYSVVHERFFRWDSGRCVE
jgi:uncharacterized membrane protein YedE/YeeE